jgi:hypothetical protein
VEPAVLAGLGRIDAGSGGWQVARDAVAQALHEAGRGGTAIVLRWLSSFVLSPARPDAIATDVAQLIAGLPVAAPVAGAVPTSGPATGAA